MRTFNAQKLERTGPESWNGPHRPEGQKGKYMMHQGKNGARDGARTRDLRRDRPPLPLIASTSVQTFPSAEPGQYLPEVGTLAIDKKETPRSLAGLAGDVSDLGKLDLDDNSDMRGGAQRRLAIKLAAGAGLSVALASCFVVLALGDGGRT